MATWTYLRRLVASVMLVAVASFVLHGSAMARMHAGGGCAGLALVAALHAHSDHKHAVEHGHGGDPVAAHVHPSGNPTQGHHPGSTPDPHASGAPCCGMSCAIAIAPLVPDLISAPAAVTAVLPALAEIGSGIDPNGLRRPPRTSDIA